MDSPLWHPYPASRTVFLSGEIEEDRTEDTRRRLVELFDENRDEPALLVINSDGGNTSAGWAVGDTIQRLRGHNFHIDTMVEGHAYSTAAMILQYGRLRFAGPNAQLMLHGSSWGRSGMDLAETEAMAATLRHGAQRQADVLHRRTGRPVREWMTLLRSNVPRFYTVQDALRLNLIDLIVPDTL